MSTDSQLDRAARIFDLCAAEQRPLRYKEIQAGLDDLNPASLNRLLRAMSELGLLHHDQDSYWPTQRVASWQHGLSNKLSLAERAENLLKEISTTHQVTSILLEQQGKRIVSIAKHAHENAPFLMDVNKRFPPRLPYFACIFWSQPDPDNLDNWVRSQMVDIAPEVAARINEGIKISKRFLKTGYYFDKELFPGQTRIAVPILDNDKVIAVIGAAALTASCNKDKEQELLEKLKQSAIALGSK